MRHRFWSFVLAVSLALGLPFIVLADLAIDADTNQVRAEYGLGPLSSSQSLSQLASIRAQQIVTNFAHPTDWQWMFNYVPGCESYMGENIAYFTSGAEPAGWPVSAWKNSPSHLENMLRDWDIQGSALYRASDGRTYAVQLFAKLCPSTPPPPPPPADDQPGGDPIVDEIPDTHM